MNKILGIVGRQGSGKSTLAELLADTNEDYVYLNIDKLVKDIYKRVEVMDDLFNHYGFKAICSYNKELDEAYIDTKKLGKIVFNNEAEMNWLNNYLYSIIEQEVKSFIKRQKNKLIIIDWALLPSVPLIKKCDLVWILDVPYETRKERVTARDNITEEYFDRREARYPNFAYDLDCDIIEFNEEEIDNLKYSIMHGGRVRI